MIPELQPLSEYEGSIAEIFLYTFLKQDDCPRKVFQTFRGILNAFSPPVCFQIMVAFAPTPPSGFRENFLKVAKEAENKHLEFELSLIPLVNLCGVIKTALRDLDPGSPSPECSLEDLIPSTLFAQDPFSVLKDPHGTPHLLNPIYPYLSFAYAYIAPTLALVTKLRDIHLAPTSLSFNGANVLAGADYLLVGKDTLVHNQEACFMDETEVKETFKEAYGVDQIVEIGVKKRIPKDPHFAQGKYQPVFHIDMFITLCGPVSITDGVTEELVLVGELDIDAQSWEQLSPAENTLLERIQEGIENAAKQLDGLHLGSRKFRVRRIPLMLDLATGNYLTWNNCLVENCWPKGERKVYLPNYVPDPEQEGLIEELQSKTTVILKEEGFGVTLISNNFRFWALEGRGSLHCIVKVLRRANNMLG